MILKWTVAGFAVLGGLLIMTSTFRSSRRLFHAQDVRLTEYLINSLAFGLSTCLLLIGVISVYGALDVTFQWAGTQICGVTALGLLVGVVAAVASLGYYFDAGKLGEALYRWFQRWQGK